MDQWDLGCLSVRPSVLSYLPGQMKKRTILVVKQVGGCLCDFIYVRNVVNFICLVFWFETKTNNCKLNNSSDFCVNKTLKRLTGKRT